MISVKNVNKHFGGVYAVRDCSLEVEKGTITSIIGPNGAGKTTLFNIICGVYQPDKGTITFDGKNITKTPCYKIGQLGVSRTFQQAKLFKNMTVKDNLLVAREARDAEIQHALNSVHFPLSMDTKASELSYGQTRLVEIARAVFKPHTLLMLDEPTAGVNPKVRQELKTILLNLKKEGNTILLIEHDMEFVMSISDEVIVMNQGTVLTHGTPARVQKDKRVLEAYLGQ